MGFVKKLAISADQLRSDYDELKSCIKIAKKYGVSKQVILKNMRKYGIARDKRFLLPVELIRMMSDGGMTSTEISKIINRSTSDIARVARTNGFTVKDRYHVGFITTHNGYVKVCRPDHPDADSKGYVHQHRIVIEESIGRRLLSSEVVHHINGIRTDNRVENLALMSKADHTSLHHTGKKGRGKSKNNRKAKNPPRSCEVHHTEITG